MCGYIAKALKDWISEEIKTVCENGKKFTNFAKLSESTVIGIKVPLKIPTREMKIEEIGPVCFSLLHITPIIIPKEM